MEDYTPKVGRACVILLIALIAVSYIPPFEICGVEFRRMEFLSMLSAPKQSEPSKLEPKLKITPKAKATTNSPKVTPIEDYDSTAHSQLSKICAALTQHSRHTRIAFMGDSFVEGDILTADLREELQRSYGGEGVGFVPFTYKQNDIRPTIKITSKGWRCYSIIERDKLPEPLAGAFSYAGWITLPEEDGATTTWRTTSSREYISRVSQVRILFVSQNSARVVVKCNEQPPKSHKIKGSQQLQQITLSQDDIHSVKFTVESGVEGFIGYGAYFDGVKARGGVSLDNLPIRSNNGSAMFAASRSINSQISRMVGGYDLIFLQYGLNVIQPTINGYTRYGKTLRQMIRHIKARYPSAAVVVVGVSDRCVIDGEEIKPMRETAGLERFQREAARSEGVAFWSMRDAMLQRGGMREFVDRGWASKDYAHITFAGGRVLASDLSRAISQITKDQGDVK